MTRELITEECGDICPHCSHFSTCSSPCYPVQRYLAKDNLTVFERTGINAKGEEVTIVYSRSREVTESDLKQTHEKDEAAPAINSQRVFNTENESPFASFNPRLKQTGVFMDKWLNGFSYADLATKYGITTGNARKIYHVAVKRVLAILAELDGQGEKDPESGKLLKAVRERSDHLPKGQKYFLLNKLFGLAPAEIAEMEGIAGSSSVRQLIIRVSDQLKSGELSLIECSKEESEAAKARLEAKRAKRQRENRPPGLSAFYQTEQKMKTHPAFPPVKTKK